MLPSGGLGGVTGVSVGWLMKLLITTESSFKYSSRATIIVPSPKMENPVQSFSAYQVVSCSSACCTVPAIRRHQVTILRVGEMLSLTHSTNVLNRHQVLEKKREKARYQLSYGGWQSSRSAPPAKRSDTVRCTTLYRVRSFISHRNLTMKIQL